MSPITSWIGGSNCMSEEKGRGSRVEGRGPANPANSRALAPRLSTLDHSSPARLAWRRFRHNRAAVASAFVLLCIVIGAIVVPWVNHKARDAISDAQFQAPTAA